MSSLNLKSLCIPRKVTFSKDRAQTVAEIADLATLDAQCFFQETHVTEGMATLLRQVFQRLTGESDQGVYRLKQAMGGGKTHNLLAAALLARDAGFRK
jgi:predicted AAA+ superfamily ATPase